MNMLLPGMGGRDLIGLDISDTDLKLAHVRCSGEKKEVAALYSRKIAGLPNNEISKIVSDLFRMLDIKNPHIVATIPSNLIITKNIEIPSVNPKEIKDIINLQAGRHTPYSREEVVVDYINIGVSKHNYTRILLVIVTRSIIKRQFDIIDKAGLRLEKVLFAPEGLAWAASKIIKLETADLPSSFVHIDENFTDFSVVFKNKVVFVRSIPIGSQYLADEKEKYKTRFIEEVKSSIEAYQNENIEKNLHAMVITGAIEDCPGLEVLLANDIHMPVKAVPYLKNLVTAGEALKTVYSTKRISFLNVIAPLLAWEEIKVDLIPEEIKLKRQLEERGRELIKTGIFILTIFVLICISLISNIYFKSTYLRSLNRNFNSLNKEAEKLERDFTRVSLIRNYLQEKGRALEVLSELHGIAPIDISINNIRYDSEGKLNIRGSTESMSTVFSFVTEMEKSKHFKDVKTRYTSKRKEGTKDMTDFEIVCLLEKEGRE